MIVLAKSVCLFLSVPGSFPSPSSTRQQNAAGDMQAEAIGRELRLIGDNYNQVLMLRVSDHRHCLYVCVLECGRVWEMGSGYRKKPPHL